MKKILLLLLMPLVTWAGSWVEFAQDPSGTTYELESTLVTKHDNAGKVLVVWTRSNNPRITSTIKYELHCASKSYRIIVEGRKSGGQEYYREDKNDRWKYAFPDSPEMALIDLTCATWQ